VTLDNNFKGVDGQVCRLGVIHKRIFINSLFYTAGCLSSIITTGPFLTSHLHLFWESLPDQKYAE
jgi:hypothetical protein